ncbi:MAG: diaminopimelate epimerase [Gammaproteobacteria bacterium]|jgi:diaminopimelate epimerase|nr:diaminopimelate epimerase [Gammaproteobacteria bacterium]
MLLRFTKMHGLGNDFVVFDGVSQRVELDAERVRHIADRHFGIGCDQVLVVEPARLPHTQFHYRIFNADGGEVEQCGNGARCFARFVREKWLTDRDVIDVGTARGRITLHFEPGGDVRVDMGRPRLEPEEIPFDAPIRAPTYAVDVGEESVEISAVSMGNPHAVLLVDDVAAAPVARLGPLLERHPRFPDRVNVGFMAVHAPDRIDLRVYERGSGETLACGTGACAAVVAGRLRGLLDPRVIVRLPGGELTVAWEGEGEPVWMIGPAVTVFEGGIEL